MRRFLLCTLAAAAVSLPAFAEVPEKGEGTITILGGWRGVPQHALMSQLQRDGLDPAHAAFQPGFIASLGFMPEEGFHVSIDLGYGLDQWQINGGNASVKILGIQLAGDTSLLKGKGWTIYLGAGLGYSLNTFSRNGADTESNGSAGFLKVGFRYQIAGMVAVVLEDRFTLASAEYPELKSIINTGGNLLSLGVMFHFASPEDKGHPQHP